MIEAPQMQMEAPVRRFKPYPEYKDSGVEWLGEMPAHWRVLPLGRIGRFSASGIDKKTVEGEGTVLMVNYTDVYSNTSKTLDKSRDYMQTTCPEWKAKEHSLVKGDILFTPSSETEAEVGFSAVVVEDMLRTVYSYHLIRLRPDARVGLDLEFSKYICNNTPVLSQFSAACKGTTRQILTREDFRGIVVLLPPVAEQRAIAAFLDLETARIDALVAKKERLIELLQEKRTALITQAVTKGLDPNVLMKDSGVEWLGAIPAHWGVGGLARWWQVIDCKHRTVPFIDEGIALASIGEVQSLEVNLSAAKRTSVEEYWQMISGGREPRRGDVIYSRNATVGAAALVTTEERFCMGQDVSLIRAADQDQRFLVFLLRSPAVMGQLDASMVGSTFSRINVSKIKSLVVCVPSLEEQREIADFCHRESENVERLTAMVRDAIELLKELRTALISAAVTGKIDVRKEVA